MKGKRVLAMLLCLVLLTAVLPVTASASGLTEEPEVTAEAEARNAAGMLHGPVLNGKTSMRYPARGTMLDAVDHEPFRVPVQSPIAKNSGEFNGSPAQVDASGNLLINSANFPDANFRSYISEKFDVSGKGYLTKAQVASVEDALCYDRDISSLKGIEYFTALTYLDCSGNKLTALDVSHNTALITLNCFSNQLTALDVSHNTALITLNCFSNQLTALDVSHNTALVSLWLYENRLTSLDLSGNTALISLQCGGQRPDLTCSEQNGKILVNLRQFVGKENSSRVNGVTGGNYDRDTGILTLSQSAGSSGDLKATYNYDTGANVSPGTMLVTVYGSMPSADTAPKITKQPQSMTAAKGTQASFNVSATGGGLSYQWQYRSSSGGNWADSGAPGSKSASISFDVATQDGYQYRCKVSNSLGTVYSDPATLTVNAAAPVITKQPQSVTVAAGAKATFAVTATGSNLNYQWQYRSGSSGNWVDSGAPGSKSASISFGVASQNGYQYRCKVSNSLGTVYSDVAILTVNAGTPVITKQPQSVTAASGAQVTFKVTATGNKLSYQWQYRSGSSGSWADSGAPGSKTATLSFVPTSQNGYQYRCKVSNSLGTVYSDAATLTVNPTAPVITKQPQSVTAASGAQVTFKVTATGNKLSYQWQYRSGSSGNWADSGAPGSKSASISFDVASQNGYQYRCKVSNSLGTVYSDVATLTVKK